MIIPRHAANHDALASLLHVSRSCGNSAFWMG